MAGQHKQRKGFHLRLIGQALHGLAVALLVTTAGTQAQYTSDSATSHAVAAALGNVSSPHPVAAPGQSLTQLPDGRWLAVGGSEHPTDLVLEYASGSRIAKLSLHLAQGRSGHSATLLPDGSVLVFGGVDGAGQVLDGAEMVDPSAMTIKSLGSIGLLPRAQHTTSVLTDGRVLFAGGVGKGNAPLLQVEIYNPKTHEIETLDGQLDRARLKHLAAMVGNSSILLWGGSDGEGRILDNGSLYSPAAGRFSGVGGDQALQMAQDLSSAVQPAVMESRPSGNAVAVPIGQTLMVHFNKRLAVTSLNADTVTLIGPNSVTPVKVVPVEDGALLFVNPIQDLQPAASYTLFVNGATDQNGRLLPFTAIGFTTESLSGKTDSNSQATTKGANSATTAGGPGSASAKASAPGTASSSAKAPTPIQKSKSPFGSSVYSWLPKSASDLFSLIEQSHATHESLVSSIDASDEVWTPGARNYHGNWTSGHGRWGQYHPPANDALNRALYGHPEIAGAMSKIKPGTVASGMLKKLVPARALTPERGTTAISGQVLRLNSRPLANVSLSVGNHLVRTDANGEFVLKGIPAGHQVMVIDGASANEGQRQYGRYEYGIDVVANQVNVLPFVIWMTRLDSGNAINIPSPTSSQTVLTNPKIPGLELRIPAGTVIRDAQGKIVTQISMTAIPTDQPPFPLPNVPVPTYFTIQPGGAHLEGANGHMTKGAQLIYPNFTQSAPGSRITFWNYDSTNKGWYIYGQGTVTADGKQVMPDPGVVIYEFSGAMVSQNGNAPPNGPAEGDGNPNCGEPVNCATGLFYYDATDLAVRDVMSIGLRRTYRPQDSASRAFGIGTNLSYDMFTVGDMNPYTYQDLVLPDGGRVHYPRISAGTGWTDAVYQNTSTPGKYFGSVLKWDQSTGYAWTLTLKDGTVYSFADEAGSVSARSAAVRAISDRFGNTVTLTRDGNFNLTQITSPNGRHLNLTYDANNRVIQASDDLGRTIVYAYDAIGRLVKVTDPAGNFEKYGYDSSSNMLNIVDKRGNTKVVNIYDANGRVAKQTYADGSTMQFAYTLNAGGTVTQTDITDQRGFVHRSVFNGLGLPTSVTRAVGRPEQQVFTYSRDPVTGLLNSYTDALGRTTAYSYDSLGDVTQVTHLSGTSGAVSTRVAYDPVYSLPVRVTDANGNVTQYSYDSAGSLLQIIDPLSHATSFTNDFQGRQLTRVDPNGNTTSYFYYAGALAGVSDALGRHTSFATDAAGRLINAVNPLGATSVYTYDALDEIKAQLDPNGSLIQFTYDPNGNVLSQIDANAHSTGYVYDTLNRVVSLTDGLLKTESYSYDAIGNFNKKIDRKSQVSGRTYDALGRLTQIGFGAAVSTPTAYASTISKTWDAGGRLVQIVDSVGGTVSRTYDGLDRLTQEVTTQGTVNYTYDAGGRRLTMTVQGQPIVTYTWDNANRLTQVQQAAGPGNGNVVQTVGLQYDNGNRRTQLTLPNGIKAAYAYDAGDHLTGIIYSQSGGAPLGSISYAYDLAGRRISVSGTLANENLPAAVSSAAYNANNQLTNWNGAAYGYDLNGNLLTDSARNYNWDARNQLAGLTGFASATFSYDGFGRRIGKTVNGIVTGFVYDGGNFVQEKSGTSATATVAANLLTGGVDEIFGRQTSAGISTPLTDALGSVVAETGSAQAVTTTYGFDPYGNTSQTGTNTGNTQQFAGRENDGTGLYYYRARYYNPGTGRFIREDPIGWASGQSNNYAYVGGNPVSSRDPSGEGTCQALILLACAMLPIGEGNIPEEIPASAEQVLERDLGGGGLDGPEMPEAEMPPASQPSSCPVPKPGNPPISPVPQGGGPPPEPSPSPETPPILTSLGPIGIAVYFLTYPAPAY